ncbi:MAG TPA: ATP-binding protein [Polyangiaceae bacterium]|nr:ATP-binding protein [Polyangiaceae bacterium]
MLRIGPDPASRRFTFEGAALEGYQRALTHLIERRRGHGLRVWIPRCGTGQAVYAHAMRILENLPEATGPRLLQIFGTDVDPLTLQVARNGRYPRAALKGLSATRRERFFIEDAETARIRLVLRRTVLFACHDFRHDPPFARLDLLSCVNALLQCPEELHPLVMVRFHFSLSAGGLLHVGSKHAAAVPSDLFELLDAESGTFLAHAGARRAPKVFQRETRVRPPSSSELSALAEELRGLSDQRLAELEMLDRTRADLHNFVEATKVLALICDNRLRIVHASSAIRERFAVDPATGTRLRDIAERLPGGRNLVALAHGVQATAISKEWTERLPEQPEHSFLIRIHPYRTPRGNFDGVVAVFTDVSALERARALTAKRERQQATVAELGLFALSASMDDLATGLEALADKALGALQEVLGFSRQVLLESTQDAGSLLAVATRGCAATALSDKLLRVEPGAHLESGLRAQGLVLVGDPRNDPALAACVEDTSAYHGVVAPLRVGESVYGVLAAYFEATNALGPEDLNFVQSIANLLSGALARQRARRRMALEHGIGLVVAHADELTTMARGLEDSLASVLGATEVELWVRPEQQPDLGLQRVWPARDDPASAGAAPAAVRTLLAEAMLERRALASTHVDETLGAVTDLVFPLVFAGAANGVVACRCRKAIALDDDLEAGLATVGRTASEFLHWKRLHEALRHSEQSFRAQSAELEAIYATLPVGLSIYDKHLAPLRINQRLRELRAPLDGPSPAECDVLRRVLESGKSVRDVELTLETDRGRKDWLCSFVAIKDASGDVASVSSVVQDITEQKRVEQALREADKQKDEFLAMLGHELRNPLAAIRNATELLGFMASDARGGRVHGVLDRQTRHMARLIDGLLDVSRIVRGKLVLERENLDLLRLLRDVVGDRSSQFEKRNIALELDLPGTPLFVNGDRVRLAQVFDNILANAAKFSLMGGTIRVTARGSDERVTVDIDDDGVGIEPQLLPHIFEPFRQAQQTIDRASGGLGLGLALVRGLVELHGGTVTAESPGHGHGTRFRVELERSAKIDQPSSIPPPNVQSLRVLVVEDNADMGETLAELLRLSGHRVIAVCPTGQEGLAAASAEQPDVILCDFGLPGELDGLAVARRIRAELDRRVQLIAITGYGDPDTRRRAKEAGFDAFLVKPVSFDMLQRQLSRAARRALLLNQEPTSTASG